MKRIIVVLLLFLSLNLSALNKTDTYKFPLKVVYSTMIRFLVVDYKADILKKDIEGAYIEFKNKEKDTSGVIEIIEIKKNKTVIKLNFKGANYKMIRFLKKFKEKLKTEDKDFRKE